MPFGRFLDRLSEVAVIDGSASERLFRASQEQIASSISKRLKGESGKSIFDEKIIAAASVIAVDIRNFITHTTGRNVDEESPPMFRRFSLKERNARKIVNDQEIEHLGRSIAIHLKKRYDKEIAALRQKFPKDDPRFPDKLSRDLAIREEREKLVKDLTDPRKFENLALLKDGLIEDPEICTRDFHLYIEKPGTRKDAIEEIINRHRLQYSSVSKATFEASLKAPLPTQVLDEALSDGVDNEKEYFVYELTSPDHLRIEGKQGDTCIGNDAQRYIRETAELLPKGQGRKVRCFSVRSKALGQIVGINDQAIEWTIWYDRESQTIQEIKGPGNRALSRNDPLYEPKKRILVKVLGGLIERYADNQMPVRAIDDFSAAVAEHHQSSNEVSGGTVLTNKREFVWRSGTKLLEPGEVMLAGNFFLTDIVYPEDIETIVRDARRAKITTALTGENLGTYLKAVLKFQRRDLADAYALKLVPVSPPSSDSLVVRKWDRHFSDSTVDVVVYARDSSAALGFFLWTQGSNPSGEEMVQKVVEGSRKIARMLIDKKDPRTIAQIIEERAYGVLIKHSPELLTSILNVIIESEDQLAAKKVIDKSVPEDIRGVISTQLSEDLQSLARGPMRLKLRRLLRHITRR